MLFKLFSEKYSLVPVNSANVGTRDGDRPDCVREFAFDLELDEVIICLMIY
jgi:hypothetical protein